MRDLDNSSVSEDCAVVCMDIHYEDWDEDTIMYGDQRVSTEEHDKAMYGELTRTESEEDVEGKYNVALCTNNSVSLEKRRRQLNESMPNENVYDLSQSDVSINENTTVNSFNNEGTTVQCPMDDNNEIELQKACTMEMSMNDGNISMTAMIEHEHNRQLKLIS